MVLQARHNILSIHMKEWKPKIPEWFLADLAERCEGYCGADLKALCTESALLAFARHFPQVRHCDRAWPSTEADGWGHVTPCRCVFVGGLWGTVRTGSGRVPGSSSGSGVSSCGQPPGQPFFFFFFFVSGAQGGSSLTRRAGAALVLLTSGLRRGGPSGY